MFFLFLLFIVSRHYIIILLLLPWILFFVGNLFPLVVAFGFDSNFHFLSQLSSKAHIRLAIIKPKKDRDGKWGGHGRTKS